MSNPIVIFLQFLLFWIIIDILLYFIGYWIAKKVKTYNKFIIKSEKVNLITLRFIPFIWYLWPIFHWINEKNKTIKTLYLIFIGNLLFIAINAFLLYLIATSTNKSLTLGVWFLILYLLWIIINTLIEKKERAMN
jgi:hypothetical protein